MTDKQIIDVSKCKFYRDEISFIGGEAISNVCSIWIWQRDYSGLEPSCVMECHCSDNSNCYYKQLKRKERECEKAKQNAQDTYDLWQAFIESFNILQGEKIKLEQEYERLKRDYFKQNEWLQEQKNKLDQLKAENEHLAEKEEEAKHYLKEAEKFKNCLTEIKEIAEDCYDPADKENDGFWTILQKINECEGKECIK